MRAKTVGYLAAFAVAIWSLATGWATLQAAWALPTAAGVLATVGYFVLFAGALGVLGFWLYATDRAAGRVQRRIGLYEWWLDRRA